MQRQVEEKVEGNTVLWCQVKTTITAKSYKYASGVGDTGNVEFHGKAVTIVYG